MKESKLKSGAVLAMQLSSLEECNAQLDAVLGELVGVKIEGFRMPEGGADFDVREIFSQDIWALKDALFKVMKSKAVPEALWPCLGRATYNGRKVTPALFEDETARGDFLAVVLEDADVR